MSFMKRYCGLLKTILCKTASKSAISLAPIAGLSATSGSLSITDINGDGKLDITFGVADNGSIQTYLGNGNGTFSLGTSFATSTTGGQIVLADINNDGIADILNARDGGNGVDIRYGNADATGRRNDRIARFDLTSIAGAREALIRTTRYLDRIGKEIGNLGALESRLSFASRTHSVTRENELSARSRIIDTDIAQESANLVRQQILQQSASAVLAQANLGPQLALKLLRE